MAQQTASVIIPAMDEAALLSQVLEQAERLSPLEILVVANGPESGGVVRAAQRAGARVLRQADRVGYDIGRALGAAEARGGVLLFLDADLPVAARDLHPFVEAVTSGVDLALNRIDPYIHPAARQHPVNAAKRFLNCVLRRPDLGYASLTAIPHALSRGALQRLGAKALALPPRALAEAVAAGLRVEAVHPVDAVRPNARRPGQNLGRASPVEQLILGDHLEAVGWFLQHSNSPRGGFGDLGRRWDLLR